MVKNLKSQISSGCILKMLRNANGLSQEGLAKLSGISSKTIYRWEKDGRIPRLTLSQSAKLYETLNLDKSKMPRPFFD